MERRVSIAWVLVSLLCAAGGVFLVSILAGFLDARTTDALAFPGMAIGATIACAAAPRPRPLESLVGGALLIAALYAVSALIGGSNPMWLSPRGGVQGVFETTFVSGFGALVGAVLGTRLRGVFRSRPSLQAMTLSFAITPGVLFAAVLSTLVLDHLAGSADLGVLAMGGFFLILSFPTAAGFICQLAIPHKAVGLSASGTLPIFAAVAFGIAMQPGGRVVNTVGMVIGFAVLFAFAWGLGALGSSTAAVLRKKAPPKTDEPAGLPAAQARG
jgi:hypothetical protein